MLNFPLAGKDVCWMDSLAGELPPETLNCDINGASTVN